jgi:hypothetical protein
VLDQKNVIEIGAQNPSILRPPLYSFHKQFYLILFNTQISEVWDYFQEFFYQKLWGLKRICYNYSTVISTQTPTAQQGLIVVQLV